MDQPSAVDAGAWWWAGKLAPPLTQLTAVKRLALLQRLSLRAQSQLLLVISPPGFGKTTLLTQWREQQAQDDPSAAMAWLSLDEADAEPGRLLAYLVLSLEAAGVPMGTLGDRARNQALDPDMQRNVAALLRCIRVSGRRITLWVDDQHRAAGPGADEVFVCLLERGGQELRLVVAARTRPKWPLSQLKMRGLLHEVNAQDLVLSQSEAADILGAAADRHTVSVLHARTEGWAVALQLARLWIVRSAGALGDLRALNGKVADIADYLAEQVVAALAPEVRDFLIDTSVLERFDAELADAVRQRHDSAELLAQLAPYDALVVPLDDDRRWFRCHGLLAEHLSGRLQPQRARAIHRAAALWLGQQADWSSAVAHAIAAQDIPAAVGLLRDAGSWQLVLRKGIPYTQGLLQQFDETTCRSDPHLLLMQAYLQAKLGDEPLATELLRLAQAVVLSAPPSTAEDAALRRDLDVITALVQVYFDCYDDHRAWPVTAEAALQRTPDDLLAQGTLLCVGAVSALAHARMDDAVSAATAARIRMRLVGSPLGENYCLLHWGQALAVKGEIAASRRVVDEALALAEANFGVDSSLKALVECFKAQHLYWQGDWAQAEPLLQEGVGVAEHVDGWLDVFAVTGELGWRIALRHGGPEAALRVLDHTAHEARARRLQRLALLVSAWRVDLSCQCNQINQARLEASASGLQDAWPQALAAPVDTQNWRYVEAGALALMRLHLANGQAREAVAVADQAGPWLQARGLQLPQWRLALLALVARRRADDSSPQALAPQLSQALAPLLTHQLSGLVLEVGPAVLSCLSAQDSPWPATLKTQLTTLRGWQAHPPRPHAQFSAKEGEVLRLLLQGEANKAIARSLGVSENTVKFHLKNIFQKLGVDSRAAAISVAMQQGLGRG